MVNVAVLLGLPFLLLLGLASVFGGLRQLYHVVVGNEEQLAVGGRFEFLFGFREPTPTEKRFFWSVGGVLLALGGLAFLGTVAFSIRSGL